MEVGIDQQYVGGKVEGGQENIIEYQLYQNPHHPIKLLSFKQ